jgi:transposase-like protein
MKLTKEDKLDIRECYAEGASIAVLAKSYEVTTQTIRNAVKDVEVKRFEDGVRYDAYRASFPIPKLSPKEKRNREICHRFRSGMKKSAIAAELGVSAATVGRVIQERELSFLALGVAKVDSFD